MAKKILSKKTWTISIVTYDDGTSELKRINEGFTPLELMGLASLASREILEQIAGRIKPTVTKRIVKE